MPVAEKDGMRWRRRLARLYEAAKERVKERRGLTSSTREATFRLFAGGKRLGRFFLIILVALLLVLVLLVGGAAAVYFGVPKMLRSSSAQEMLSGTPDRAAAQTLTAEAAKAGISTKGVEVYVVPFEGTDENLAVVLLDASQGFTFSRTSRGDPIKDYLTPLAAKVGELNISRAAVVYRDEKGQEIGTATASAEAITAFVQGRMSREQFAREVEADINVSAVVPLLREQGVIP
ncbi:MAG: hypothetical protein HY685_04630 [Chloroflexi bacterium]|nr:hypothetical protein [Chloroflexota bacterium]